MRKVYKKLSSHGSISIPVELRREMGLEPKDPMEVVCTDDNRIMLSPYTPRCIFCGSQEGIGMYRNKGICHQCRANITEGRDDG